MSNGRIVIGAKGNHTIGEDRARSLFHGGTGDGVRVGDGRDIPFVNGGERNFLTQRSGIFGGTKSRRRTRGDGGGTNGKRRW